MLALLKNIEIRAVRVRTSDFHRVTSSSCWSHFAPLSARVNQQDKFLPTTLHIRDEIASPRVFPSKQQVVYFRSSRPNYDIQDDFKKHLKLMLNTVDWKESLNSPKPALGYGAGGLIPFVIPPLAILINGAFLPNIAFAQLAYGATILSFLGGVKWGFAVPDSSSQKLSWENLGFSVSMSLIGWGSLLLPQFLGSLTLMGGLAASSYIDIMSPGYPNWFKALRLCLTSVAIGSIGLTMLLRVIL